MNQADTKSRGVFVICRWLRWNSTGVSDLRRSKSVLGIIPAAETLRVRFGGTQPRRLATEQSISELRTVRSRMLLSGGGGAV